MNVLSTRIEELMGEMRWDAGTVARVAGVTPSAVSQWLGHGTKEIKSIGKMEAAVLLERATGFSAFWLAQGKGPKRVGGAGWPFPGINSSRFHALTSDQKIEIQGLVRERIERFEVEHELQKSPNPIRHSA
jgi:hypothetical protein